MLHVALLTRRLKYRGVGAWNMPPEKYFETLETHKNKWDETMAVAGWILLQTEMWRWFE